MCLSGYVSIYLPIHVAIDLSIDYRSIDLSIYLSIYPLFSSFAPNIPMPKALPEGWTSMSEGFAQCS